MKKDSYYFPHFCNARHDRKIKRIIKDLGVEGYGLFFMLLEVLREQTDFKYPVCDIDLLADEFGTSEAKLQAIIQSYGLFDLGEDGMFFSGKLILYLQPYLERSERARKAATKRWNDIKQLPNNQQVNANALPKQCPSNASKVKKSKVNKVKKINKRNNVLLLPNEIKTLESKYDSEFLEMVYDKLHFYKLQTGKRYKSDYGAINSWVLKSVKEEKEKSSGKKEKDLETQINEYRDYVERNY